MSAGMKERRPLREGECGTDTPYWTRPAADEVLLLSGGCAVLDHVSPSVPCVYNVMQAWNLAAAGEARSQDEHSKPTLKRAH